MRLSEFIRTNQKAIVMEWEDYARTCPPAPWMTRLELRNNITGLLDYIVRDLEEPQSRKEREARAKGFVKSEDAESEAIKHAEQRFRKGFDTLEMISEFRVLRATILKIWACPRTDEGIMDLNRFNEAIDQVMMDSLQKYMENEKRARTLFLGTLIHDLRNPVTAIAQAVQAMSLAEHDEETGKLVAIIQRSAKRIGQLASQLIDAVRIRLGRGIPVAPEAADLGGIASEVVEEIRMAHPGRIIKLSASGDVSGEWDSVRMRQLFSNLVGNAVQHSCKSDAVYVALEGEGAEVVIIVHNTGSHIPADQLPGLFDPLTRGLAKTADQPGVLSLGLGLFITHEIVTAHAGKISVTSTAMEGTTFTVKLPKIFSGKPVMEDEIAASHMQAEIENGLKQ